MNAQAKHLSKAMIIAFGLILVLCFSLGYYVGVNTTSLGIHIDDLPTQAMFTVKSDGTKYWAVRYDGKIPSGMTSTDLNTVVNAVTGALTAGRTWKEKIAFRGNFLIDSTLWLGSYDYVTYDFIEAYFKQANGTNLNPMVQITGTYTDAIGGVFDGNKPFQTGGDFVLDFECYGSLIDATVLNGYSTGLYIHSIPYSSLVSHIISKNNDGNGVLIAASYDVVLNNVLSEGNGLNGFRLFGVYRASLTNCVARDNSGNGFQLDCGVVGGYCDQNTLTSCIITNSRSVGKHGFAIAGGIGNTFSGCLLHNFASSTNNIYDGFNFAQGLGARNSSRNIVTGCHVSADAANKHRYGIREEDASQDFNLYHGNILLNAVTAPISKQGANSVNADNMVA